MNPIEEIKEQKQALPDSIKISHERRRVQRMKVIFGLFSAALLLFLIISLILNR
jgi:predicted nucleic acid-binding Zn ribbon protein